MAIGLWCAADRMLSHLGPIALCQTGAVLPRVHHGGDQSGATRACDGGWRSSRWTQVEESQARGTVAVLELEDAEEEEEEDEEEDDETS